MSHPYNRAYYDDGKTGYLAYRDFPSHWRIVKIILDKKPESVLDVGAGRGYIVKKLEANGIRAICMDISENAWHCRATNSFIIQDARVAPWKMFGNKDFDLCMSTSFMEHLTEPEIEIVIKEMARVSRRGYHTITFEKTPQDIDVTHRTFKPVEWWLAKFKEYAPDYPVEIMTKEEAYNLERTTIEFPPSDGLTKINIGSFTDAFHYNWENWDSMDLSAWMQQNGYVFKQVDVTKGIPKRDNSVDVLLASHFLEHLSREEGAKFLAECFRVLKPDGLLRLAVPDSRLLANKYLDGSIMEFRHFNIGVEKAPDTAEAFYHLLLAGHKTIYDYDSLRKALATAGFADSNGHMHFNKFAPFDTDSKTIATQTIPMYPSLSLVIECRKPSTQNIENLTVAPSTVLDYLKGKVKEGKQSI